ncbi:hypothetical protein [Bacteriovorax sp. Seq25_V]|uniref:hypothetical protein n=1 Tax=Bacteriovorax sp. Seq25_V TaxID=1201288 RepID=UPI00038A4B43|nr:hypothetical protein [Bacteriovorax sp. Seq25_V]EQC44333.1 hypothetical protein M900_A0409 [Bacteriovorax sp. Seq25_V]
MKKAAIYLLFITSCSQFPGRYPSSKQESFDSCNVEIFNFKNNFKNIESKKYQKYNQYLNDLNYTHRERRLESSIKNWMEIGERNITIEQMRHHGAFAKIKSAFDLDSPYAIATSFEPLFKEIESSYFITLRSMKYVNNLKQALEKLDISGEIDSQIKNLIEDYNVNHIYNTIDISIEIKALRTLLQEEVTKLNDLAISESFRLQKSYEQYKVAIEFLEKRLTTNDASKEKASKILEKLATEEILATCKLCQNGTSLVRPSLASIEHLLRESRISRIMYLERQRWTEMWVSLSSRLPNKLMYQLIDITLAKIPKLNNSSVRKFFRSKMIDMRDITKHFPNIDRVLFSEASAEDLVKLILNIESKTGDSEFLITFARRVDAHDRWNEVYKWLKANVPDNKLHQNAMLLEKMDKAWVEANNRGSLPKWHAPESTSAMRFLIDSVFLTAVSYTGYEAFIDGVEEIEDVTGLDLIKQQEMIEQLQKDLEEQQKKIEIVTKSGPMPESASATENSAAPTTLEEGPSSIIPEFTPMEEESDKDIKTKQLFEL